MTCGMRRGASWAQRLRRRPSYFPATGKETIPYHLSLFTNQIILDWEFIQGLSFMIWKVSLASYVQRAVTARENMLVYLCINSTMPVLTNTKPFMIRLLCAFIYDNTNVSPRAVALPSVLSTMKTLLNL